MEAGLDRCKSTHIKMHEDFVHTAGGSWIRVPDQVASFSPNHDKNKGKSIAEMSAHRVSVSLTYFERIRWVILSAFRVEYAVKSA